MSDHTSSPSPSPLALALGQPIAAGGGWVPGGIALSFLSSSGCCETVQALKSSFIGSALNWLLDKVVADVVEKTCN